jgi:osmotically inducible lipoprotein OsmB
MISIQRFAGLASSAALVLALGACAGMSQHDKNMVVGASVGAVGGAVLAGGAAAVVGGAVVGGVIGHEIDKDKKQK